jgi:hypothetical protein
LHRKSQGDWRRRREEGGETRHSFDILHYFKTSCHPISRLKISNSQARQFHISNFKFEIPNFSLLPLFLYVSVAILLSSCGYRVGGTASQLPPGLKVIAVPAFENRTNRYRVEQRMTQAVVREFLARTKYRIVPTEDSADAVLHGEITSFEATPAVFDTTPTPNSTSTPNVNTTTARVTTMLVSVQMKVRLEERDTKRVLYQNDNYIFREPYEISTNSSAFFDEQGPALERISRDFASRLVADILENF